MDLSNLYQGGGNGKGLTPFFKKDDLPKKGSLKVKFTSAAREASGGFSDIFVDISAGKKSWTLGLQAGVLLDQIMDKVGKNSNKWKGKTVELYLAKGKYINAR